MLLGCAPTLNKRLIETSRKYIIDREMAKLLGERGEVEANIARAKARMGEIRLQIIAIDETARTEAQRELSAIEPKLSELRERRVAIEDRLAQFSDRVVRGWRGRRRMVVREDARGARA